MQGHYQHKCNKRYPAEPSHNEAVREGLVLRPFLSTSLVELAKAKIARRLL